MVRVKGVKVSVTTVRGLWSEGFNPDKSCFLLSSPQVGPPVIRHDSTVGLISVDNKESLISRLIQVIENSSY